VGETPEGALGEIRGLPSIGDADVRLLVWEGESWTGRRERLDQVFPTWVTPEDHPLVGGVAAATAAVLGRAPRISRWVFSTNGVASAGRLGIPTVGFAPGKEELAHSVDEWVAVDDLVAATAVYSLIPEHLTAESR
jgi:acetylornithine deacetylase/succinyl-diaminopimelate desuccinylase-like protein